MLSTIMERVAGFIAARRKRPRRTHYITEEEQCISSDGLACSVVVSKLNHLQSCFSQNYDPERHTIVCSSTGSGKTIVANIAISRQRRTGKKTVMLAPTKQLTNELYAKMRIAIGASEVGRYTGAHKNDRDIDQKDVIVATPEAYLSAYRSQREWASPPPASSKEAKSSLHARLMIVDEAHNILDRSRGGSLDAAMAIFRENGGKLLLMSGTLYNKDELAKMLDADMFISQVDVTKHDIKHIISPKDIDAEPAPKKRVPGIIPTTSGHVYNRDSIRISKLKQALGYSDYFAYEFGPDLPMAGLCDALSADGIEPASPGKQEHLPGLDYATGPLTPTIQWLNQILRLPDLCQQMKAKGMLPQETEKTASLARKAQETGDIEDLKALNREILAQAYPRRTPQSRALTGNRDLCMIIFVPTKDVGYCLSSELGFPFHCADIDEKEKDAIVNQFNSGVLRKIIATSTLAQGVNTPADSVIICGTSSNYGNYIDPATIRQMIGRAGRNKPEATVYIIGDDNELGNAEKDMQTMTAPLPTECMLMSKLSNRQATRGNLISSLLLTYAATLVKKSKVHTEVDRILKHLAACDIINVNGSKYTLTNEGCMLARYFIDPTNYMGYKNLAQRLSEIPDATLTPEYKGCLLIAHIMDKLPRHNAPKRYEKDLTMAVSSVNLLDDFNDIRIPKVAALLDYYRTPSSVPPYFGATLQSSVDRWIGMFADMERFKVYEHAPGKDVMQPILKALHDASTTAKYKADTKKAKMQVVMEAERILKGQRTANNTEKK